jgi:hypothetical protein
MKAYLCDPRRRNVIQQVTICLSFHDGAQYIAENNVCNGADLILAGGTRDICSRLKHSLDTWVWTVSRGR